jgi:hypothetical protein
MHLRHPVVLTTVEEDFKAIGLLTEDDVKKSKGKEEVTADKESTVKKGKGEKKEDAGADDGEETLAELKQSRVKRHTSSERMKWRRAKKRGGAKSAARKYRKKASVKRMLKKHRMKASRLRHGKAAGRRRIHFGNDNVANMLEDTQELLASLDEAKVENSIKAFANVAIIAEMLARSFSKFSEDVEGEEQENLESAAGFFAEMAEEAADIARGLKEAEEEIDFEEIDEVFKAQMGDLLNGLEMYADITEDDDLANIGEEDDDDDDDDDEDEDDKEEAKDDDEDEDDDEGGDKKKAPPFMKKGEKKEGHKPGKSRYGK